MLLTTCPTCAAQFKVLPEHLNVRQGRVMCGRCRGVFNAFESLKRVEDPPLTGFPHLGSGPTAGSAAGSASGTTSESTSEFTDYPSPLAAPMSEMGPAVGAAGSASPPAHIDAARPAAAAVASRSASVHQDVDTDMDPELARLLAEYDKKQHPQDNDALNRSQRLRTAIDQLEAETRDMHAEIVKIGVNDAPVAAPIVTPAIEPVPAPTITPASQAAHARVEPTFVSSLGASAGSASAVAPNVTMSPFTSSLPTATRSRLEIEGPSSTFGDASSHVLSNDNNDNGPISDVREPRLNLAALGIGLSTPSPSVSSSAAVNANAAAASMPSFTAVSFDDDDVERARLNDPLQDYAGDPANPLLRQQLAAKREPRTRWWGFGVVFLVLAVAALLTFIFRDALATNLPRLRAPFAAVCERLGCKLAYMRDASAIKIDSSDFTESPTKPGRYLLVATLANRSGIKQDLPHLDLRLTDNANQAVLSRTISPAEYLGRPLTTDDGIVPIGNISVNLELEVVGKTAASGYAIVAFYP